MATRWISDKPQDYKATPNFEKAVQTRNEIPLVRKEKPTSRLEPQYEDVYRTWSAKPDKANTAKMLSAIDSDINKGVMAHIGQMNPLLKSRARIMTAKALKKYNPDEASLSTFVVNNLQSLKRENRKQTQIISVPERVFYDQNYVREAETGFELENGRLPTDEELADATGLSLRRLNHIRKFHQGISEGSLAVEDEDSEFSFSPAVTGGKRNISPFVNVVYDDADQIDKKIMEWTFGLNGNQKLPNHVIASKLRITPGAVSQRKAKIQTTLGRVMDFNG